MLYNFHSTLWFPYSSVQSVRSHLVRMNDDRDGVAALEWLENR